MEKKKKKNNQLKNSKCENQNDKTKTSKIN
jgi:hypothetical protein